MIEPALKRIDILPAIYNGKLENGLSSIKCLHGTEVDTVEYRVFDESLLDGIENPKYLLIGIMTGIGFMQITVCDGTKFEKYFKTKWKTLMK